MTEGLTLTLPSPFKGEGFSRLAVRDTQGRHRRLAQPHGRRFPPPLRGRERVGGLPPLPPRLTGLIQNAIDAIALGSLYALVALGIGLIFGIMRLINFAHGDFIMLGAYALIVPSSAVTATLLIGAWPTPLLIGGICLSSC